MTKEEILNTVVTEVTSLAKDQATSLLGSLSVDELTPLVQAQIKTITDPLEAEINTTSSVWVKIRNRLYITAINNAVTSIVASIQSGLVDLVKK
ncbi:hypothetical protein NXG27_03965 [Megasphaera paucivorans]|uniref:Uncharacterized protein n=1 Tax=Megasphaera paucivorans TaxID=349095 RepID=A0A1G9QXC0_9FIRM|nr:hypothetical protein [Megasphaera paucivorans]SDM15658.1 hypothetical protein SAMN05660299_00319 [Megasphaera paucivorans]